MLFRPVIFMYTHIDPSTCGEYDQDGWNETTALTLAELRDELEEKHSKSFRDEGTYDYAAWEITAKKLHHVRISVEITRKTTSEIIVG